MSAKADELRVLADRCEREDGSFALERAIAEAVGAYSAPPRNYTVSLDAAVTLVPPDPANPPKPMLWSVAYDEDGVGGVRSYCAGLGKGYHDPQIIYGHSDKSAALALCAASLKARAQQAVEERT